MTTAGSVENDGLRIDFEVTGDGPAVVLGHSFLCDRSMWRAQVPELAKSHRVINVDSRGHGNSSPVTTPCTLYDLVSDVEAVLDELEIESAAWAGLSIGGMVAMRAALTRPDRVAGLILLNTDGGSETGWRKLKFSALASMVRLLGMRAVVGQVESQMFGRTFRSEHADIVAEWSDRLSSVDVPSMLCINEALKRRDDVLDQLACVTVPALVLAGSEDEGLPPIRSRRIADALPHADWIELERCGHLSAVEQPDRVTSAMVEFLKRHE